MTETVVVFKAGKIPVGCVTCTAAGRPPRTPVHPRVGDCHARTQV